MGVFSFIGIGFFLVSLLLFSFAFFFYIDSGWLDFVNNYLCGVFLFDSLSFYFLLLVVLLGVYSQFSFFSSLSRFTRFCLFISLLFSCISFVINHAVLFWCFYELSMLPLLYLIFSDSPYSERFLAGWYFSCYFIVTSLPLILALFYLSLVNGSFLLNEWVINYNEASLVVMLSFIFFTKIPLVPFHTWLPIVHAEATSIVSIFLSGYIMKMGLLGVYRCCNCVFDDHLLSYLALALVVSVMFLVASCSELDGKRWLAFLSLSHIVVPFFAFFIGDWSLVNYSFFYSLGHGLSAGLVFGLLWYLYEVCGSRNLILIKSGIGGSGIMLYVVFSLLSLCSFPTTIQFFCEIGLLTCCFYSMVYMLFWCFYLFIGGLVPLILVGHLLIRCEYVEGSCFSCFKYFNFFLFLIFWCYFGVFLL